MTADLLKDARGLLATSEGHVSNLYAEVAQARAAVRKVIDYLEQTAGSVGATEDHGTETHWERSETASQETAPATCIYGHHPSVYEAPPWNALASQKRCVNCGQVIRMKWELVPMPPQREG